MSMAATMPIRCTCQKCSWSLELDYAIHGPSVPSPYIGDAANNDLQNWPNACPSCGSSRLEVQRGLFWMLKGYRESEAAAKWTALLKR